jgi:hypothetical protein
VPAADPRAVFFGVIVDQTITLLIPRFVPISELVAGWIAGEVGQIDSRFGDGFEIGVIPEDKMRSRDKATPRGRSSVDIVATGADRARGIRRASWRNVATCARARSITFSTCWSRVSHASV